jgi:1-acyl-sn-glycerol-3-phosphate acyltransferase
VDEALKTLERGISLLVFPEGTRSPAGRLQRFKHGVFVLALRAGVPIVPITLDGAAAIMPKGRWEICPGLVRVTIHPAVETRNRGLEERQRLAEQVRAIMASALPLELRGEVEGPAVPRGWADEI